MSEGEIQRMLRDAEAHADEDRKTRALVQSRNEADALRHSTRKSLGEHGDQPDAGERAKIDDAIEALEEAMHGSDKDAIDARIATLPTASQKLGKKVCQQASRQSAQQSQQSVQPDPAAAAQSGPVGPENVVDADFKQVRH